MTGDSAVVGPIHQIACRIGAESAGMRGDSDAAEIESIGIPAGLDRGISLGKSVSMRPASFVEQLEAIIIEMHKRTPERPSKIPSPLSVAVIDLFIHPPRIVEKREERHHFGIGAVCLSDAQTVLHHPRPVCDSVMSAMRQAVFLEDDLHNFTMVMHDIIPARTLPA